MNGMNSGMNGMSPGPGRNGPGSAQPSPSVSGGAVPKMKIRKKVPGHPYSQPLPLQQLPPQLHPQATPQQLLAQMHLHSPTNGQSLSNKPPTNRLPQSVCKNIPKNQLLFDWQSPSSHHRSCRSRHASLELYDSASDESVSQDNRHHFPNTPYRGIFPEINGSAESQLYRLRMNGHDNGSGSPSEISSHSISLNNGTGRNVESSQRILVDNKKINIPSSTDRTQVEHRLHQIQDYIKQTSSLIESYRTSNGGATGDPNTEFLVGVLKDLYDSEAKLKCMLSAFDLMAEDEAKTNVESPCAESTSRSSLQQEPQVNGSDYTVNAISGTTKSIDTRKQNEIKMKFEESLRQLHSLQAEQASLIQKRREAQEQLQEAQRARNILLAMSSSGCPVNAQSDSVSEISVEQHSSDTSMNNLQDVDRQLSAFRGRNQPVAKTEGNQSSPSKELSNRKKLPTEASDVTTYLKELLTGDEVKEQASSEDSAVEDAIDEYAEARAQVRMQGQIVQEKVAEITALRAQLDQAKSLLNQAQRSRDSRSQTSGTNSADEAELDQAVNIQRQRKSDGEAAATNHPDTKTCTTSSKQQLLDQERTKLGKLRALLATVQELHSSGQPIPEHILSEFGCEIHPSGSRITSPTPSASLQKEAHEEDAAVEADVEEDDEPESTTQWNQQHLSLIESAAMASELSQGLQQRAAQLKVERDDLAIMQRQLDGLFSQLQQHQSSDKPTESQNIAAGSIGNLHTSSPSPPISRNAQEVKRADEVTHRRMEILSELHSRWQQLQEEIALDGDLHIKAAPVLSAAKSALNLLTTHILPETEETDYNEEITWDQRSFQDRGLATPTRSEHTPLTPSRGRQHYQESQMSSAPSTLMRRKSATDMVRNQRAVWSNVQDTVSSSNNTLESPRYNSAAPEENPPIISMPSPSPNILQQQAQEIKDRLAALSHSCQSLCMEGVDAMNPASALPLMPVIPPPPPPTAGSASHDREAYYQQLLAAGQLQQHQVLLTAVNQCFHILKMQQNELLNLSNSIHMLTSGASHVVPCLPGAHHPGVHPAVHPGVHPGVHAGLLQNEEQWPNPAPAPGPAPTLNNQVPPGNRTNNYWDNFRSYSRQNLLSTSAKSNEGLPHSPSPLVERSHNSLRSSTPMSVPGPSSISVASTLPQFHSLATPPCLPGVAPGLAQAAVVSDASGSPMGAVGPVPTAMDFSHSAPLVQNISRKDKRNIGHIDGAAVGVQGSPRRRPSNEIDHRTASRVLEDAALPLNSQMLSPTSQDFEVPSMPILRNSVTSLQSRLNQVNLNAPQSLANLQDFMEAPNTRQQLNNEGVPFSEISTSISNHQINEFGGFCSLDHASSRRLNMDYHNGTSEVEPTTSTVLKRNTGAIKRTYTSPSPANNPSAFSPHYQRNIHSSSAVSHLSLSNSASNADNSNASSNLSSMFLISNGDSDTMYKSSKQQSSQDTSRNFNFVGRRPAFQEEFQVPPSSASSRSKMHGINETDGRQPFRHDEDIEYEDIPMLRGVGFNNCQSSTSSLSSSSQNTLEIPNFGPGKNQLKESCFQIRKCPKYQTKSGSRSPLSDTATAAAVAAAAVAQSSPAHRNVHRSSTKSQTANWVVNKNNQDYAPSQLNGQGQLFEELRESVYAEMTSLIAANGGKSHFLVQLLRDLQHISSDSVRQNVLQLIQQAVSRYQIDLGSLDLEGCTLPLDDEAEDDEDEAKRLEMQRLPYAGACSSSDLEGSVASVSSTQEGETLMQLVLGLELAAVLSANADENCSSSLIEDIRNRIIQLIPVPHNLSAPGTPTSNSSRSVSYLHSQIDSVLEGVLLKFQGQRIGDVRSEFTQFVVGALPIKLMYRSMVDYYSCNNNNMQSEGHTRRDGSFRESALSPSGSTRGQSSHQYPQHSSHTNHQDGRDIGLLAEASNGDLAEADQSHHALSVMDGDGDSEADRDCSTEGQVSESTSTLLHVHVYQLSGASEVIDSEPEVEALQEDGEHGAGERVGSRIEMSGAVGGIGLSAAEINGREDVPQSWSLDQDCDRDDLEKDREREQGLDQVPTRLACDSDRDQENGEKHISHRPAMPPNDHSSSS